MIRFVQREAKSKITDAEVKALSDELGLSFRMLKLLSIRGITDKNEIKTYLRPGMSDLSSPYLFKDMRKAVDVIKTAINNGENICIFGDYDVDGICATSMLQLFLSYIGANVTYRIPSRHSEGYGMSASAVGELADSGVNLIITVDNGIAAADEIAYAYERGMRVIVTDHHKPQDELPKCEAILCHTVPELREDNTPALCGAGTALKLIQAMSHEEVAKQYLPFAGLATVADVMELKGENRAIVKMALEQINAGMCPIGLAAIIKVAGLNFPINEHNFGFSIAPRLNAAGRLANASEAVKLMCSADFNMACIIAEQLNTLNNERRDEEYSIMNNVKSQLDSLGITKRRAVILKGASWNPGIIGIAAARLVDKYFRPTILFAENQDGILTGSARSIPGVDIFKVLSEFSHLYERFGGHSYAAGITMKSENFDEFARLVEEYIENNIPESAFIPAVTYDFELELSEINMEMVTELELMSPFGEGNPQPVFLTRGTEIVNLQRIGEKLTHLRGRVSKDGTVADLVSFDKGKVYNEIMDMDLCDIVYSPTINEWRNMKNVQLQVKSFKAAGVSDTKSYLASNRRRFVEAAVHNLVFDEYPEEIDVSRLHNVNTAKMTSEEYSKTFDGTLTLCFTERGAAEVIELFNRDDFVSDMCFASPKRSKCGYNMIALAPLIDRLDANATYYKQIIIFDRVMSMGQLSKLMHVFTNAEFYIDVENASTYSATAASVICENTTREVMGNIYQAMYISAGGRRENASSLVKHTSAASGVSLKICELALDIFEELALVVRDSEGGVTMCSGMRVNLSDSKLYRAASGMFESMEKCNSELERLLINN